VNSKEWTFIFSLAGFISAFVGYSFHPYLWDSAFYHCISIAFVFYTLSLRCSSSGNWYWVPLVCSLNAFVDEMRGLGSVFDWTEYISFGIILLVIFVERKRAIQNIIRLLLYLQKK
jgi:hypothetical protein